MANCVQDPGRLRALAAAIRSKELSPSDLVQQYLERIDVVQPVAHPWRVVDVEGAIKVAAERTAQAERGEILGPLHGIPLGVKDIIDVAGLPTRCNCEALNYSPPAAADAEVVLSLKASGAIVIGKPIPQSLHFSIRLPRAIRTIRIIRRVVLVVAPEPP